LPNGLRYPTTQLECLGRILSSRLKKFGPQVQLAAQKNSANVIRFDFEPLSQIFDTCLEIAFAYVDASTRLIGQKQLRLFLDDGVDQFEGVVILFGGTVQLRQHQLQSIILGVCLDTVFEITYRIVELPLSNVVLESSLPNTLIVGRQLDRFRQIGQFLLVILDDLRTKQESLNSLVLVVFVDLDRTVCCFDGFLSIATLNRLQPTDSQPGISVFGIVLD